MENDNKKYVKNLICKIFNINEINCRHLDDKDSLNYITEVMFDELIHYKRMWDTLKAESGYRNTLSDFGLMYHNATIKQLMEHIEQRGQPSFEEKIISKLNKFSLKTRERVKDNGCEIVEFTESIMIMDPIGEYVRIEELREVLKNET